MVTKRCAWGVCKSDSRYKDRDHMKGVWFVPFPKPKSQQEKCIRWVKSCGRPHDQLNVDKIREHHFVCSKHFPGGNGPSSENPDPLQAEPTDAKKPRYAQKRRYDSTPATDNNGNTHYNPKMSRRCAAEALLSLKVGSTSTTTVMTACNGNTVKRDSQVAADDHTMCKTAPTVKETVQACEETVKEHLPNDVKQLLGCTAPPPIYGNGILDGGKV